MEWVFHLDTKEHDVGYSTHYLGGPKIVPPLNQSEVMWLGSYAATQIPSQDPYHVAMNPGADHLATAANPEERDAVVMPNDWLDSRRRDWAPTAEGCHLYWLKARGSNDAARQFEYLIEHFLGPGAKAADDGRREFREFTFDHVLSGVVAAERSDGRLSLIHLQHNEVFEQVLVSGLDDLRPW